MDLYKIFSDEYTEIKATSSKAIDLFLETNDDGIASYLKPVESIFMHQTNNEMFIILDCTDMSISEIEKTFKKWEKIFLSYINFGEEYKSHKKFLKFNTTLILMCKDLPEEDDDLFRYQVEKSKAICRKLFILVDEENNIIESNKSMIPFYFNSIINIKNKKTEEYEKKLEKMLPKDKNLRILLENNEDFNEDIYNIVLNWREKDE